MRRRQALRFLALDFGFYTLVAALFATQKVAVYAARGEQVGANGLLLTLFGNYTWAALTPVIWWLSRRFPVGRRGRRRNLLTHALLGVGIVAVDIFVYAALDHYLFHFLGWGSTAPPLAGQFLALFLWGAAGDLLWYGSVVAVAHALAYREMSREGQARASRLEGRLAAARLQVLKTQLQPHFLFNTLHTISTLLGDDPPAARRMISRLGNLLRRTLETDAQQEVPLREELEVVGSYLEIQHMRFEDRLTVRQEIAPETLDAWVPNLVLQPIVENALRHGIAPRAGPGRIEIRAARLDGRLRLEVRDDGAGLPAEPRALREGLGLANTRARLHQLYGGEARLELANAPGGGLAVTIALPFRTAVERERAAREGASPGVADPGRLSLPRGWPLAACAAGAWLLFGILLSGQSLMLAAADGPGLEPGRFLLIGYQSLAWAAFTLLIFRLCERAPLGRSNWRRNLRAHATANALLLCGGTLLLALVDEVFGWITWFEPVPTSPGGKVVRLAITGSVDFVIRYWLVVGVAHAISYGHLFRERERRAEALEARLAETELQLLRLHLHPGFLFDALSAIAARVAEDPRGADRMLTRLSDILRIVLDHDGEDEVSLERELSFLEPYLQLQQARFGGRMTVDLDVAPEALEAPVPNLLLQSLVEITLPRGLGRALGRAALAIRARRRNDRLAIEVRNDGGSESAGAGFGASDLEDARIRLRRMYGEDQRFVLESTPAGMRVLVEIPYRSDPPALPPEGGPSASWREAHTTTPPAASRSTAPNR